MKKEEIEVKSFYELQQLEQNKRNEERLKLGTGSIFQRLALVRRQVNASRQRVI
jgi:hypothetical protein